MAEQRRWTDRSGTPWRIERTEIVRVEADAASTEQPYRRLLFRPDGGGPMLVVHQPPGRSPASLVDSELEELLGEARSNVGKASSTSP